MEVGAGLTPVVASGTAPQALFEAQHAAAVAVGMMAAEAEIGEAASAPAEPQHRTRSSDTEAEDAHSPTRPPALEQAMPLMGQGLPSMGHASNNAAALAIPCWAGLNRLAVLMTIASAPEEFGVPRHRVCFHFDPPTVCGHGVPSVLRHCTDTPYLEVSCDRSDCCRPVHFFHATAIW